MPTTEGQFKLEPNLRRQLTARYERVDGHILRSGVEASLAWLRANQKAVNALNVFPIPDGDTGTNMVLTMESAWAEIESHDTASVDKIAHAVAQGALMGARGNSGVILSQLWRGFARAIDGRQALDVDAIVDGLAEARDTAYKGVVRPVEGTILTVSKDIASAAKAARQQGISSVLDLLEGLVEAADRSVEGTPALLPTLREAGVVDAGGKGLHILLEGMLRAAYRLPLDEPTHAVQSLSEVSLDGAAESIEPGQDWEVVVDFRPAASFDLSSFYERLEAMGTSIQVGEGDGMYRMHIHVADDTQYEPIEYIRGLGTVTKVAIENLMEQMEQYELPAQGTQFQLEHAQPGRVAVVAVAPGPGIARVFASLGSAAIVEGGQTMNPSTEQILSAIENLPTDRVIVLPNNKNILLAARQAADLTVKDVDVLPSVSVPQGITAMLRLDPEADLETNTAAMSAAMQEVTYGEMTVATRNVEIDGMQVRQGQAIGLLNGRLVVSADNLGQALTDLLLQAVAPETELISLYYGGELTAQQANLLADHVRRLWPDHEVELVEGGQPHYSFILSVE